MSAQINLELKAYGVAKVIAILRGLPKAGPGAARAIRRYFVASDLSQARALADASMARGRVPRMRFYPNLGIALGTVTRDGLASLRAERDLVVRVTGAPAISLIRPTRIQAMRLTAKATWGVIEIGAPDLWKEGYTGKGVLVGHLDTGIDGKHPAVSKAVVEFAEFDDLGRLKSPAPKPHDSGDHGTHTAATIAGRPTGGRSVGVAPGAGLASAMVIEGGDVVARVLGGMDWAVGRGVKVLSMSLGFRGWMGDFEPLTSRLRTLGVLPVFAVGNEGPGTSRSPGNYWQALSVGAIDRSCAVADFSSSQRFKRAKDPVVPDLVAPGVGVVSARPGGGYQVMDGTSMATPHVAGLAALLWQAKPAATVDEIERAIFASCRLARGMDAARANRGVPHGRRALDALLRG
jgi:subtilisin family serine protease